MNNVNKNMYYNNNNIKSVRLPNNYLRNNKSDNKNETSINEFLM